MPWELERLLDEPLRLLPRSRALEGEEIGAQDVYETEDRVVVQASLPGVMPEDLQVSVSDRILTVRGEMTQEDEARPEQLHRQERRDGTFTRSVTLPSDAEFDKAEAAYENGVLTISMPKKEQAQAKPIRVQVKPTIEGKKASQPPTNVGHSTTQRPKSLDTPDSRSSRVVR